MSSAQPALSSSSQTCNMSCRNGVLCLLAYLTQKLLNYTFSYVHYVVVTSSLLLISLLKHNYNNISQLTFGRPKLYYVCGQRVAQLKFANDLSKLCKSFRNNSRAACCCGADLSVQPCLSWSYPTRKVETRRKMIIFNIKLFYRSTFRFCCCFVCWVDFKQDIAMFC